MRLLLLVFISFLLLIVSPTKLLAQAFYEIGNSAYSVKDYNDAAYFFSFDESDYALFKVGNDNVRHKIKSANIFGNLLEYNSIVFNGSLFYSASEGDMEDPNELVGQELWISDGTTEGTHIVKDIYTGMSEFGDANSGYPTNFTVYNGLLYFIASDATHGRELWVTDGTEAGTVMVKDINPGTEESNISDIVVMNNHLYFMASDSGTNRRLWVSDGTDAGTHMITDVVDDLEYNNPIKIIASSNKIFFTAIVGALFNNYNYELWASDGQSIWLVEDINGTSNGSINNIGGFVVLNDQLVFSADDGSSGNELWISDGTESGTNLVKDIAQGSEGSGFRFPFLYDNKVYFKAYSIETGHSDIWVTDGTNAGTELFFPLNEDQFSYTIPFYAILNERLYLRASADELGIQLWRSSLDGNDIERLMPAGIDIIDACESSEVFMANQSIYFNPDYDGQWPLEMWRYTDGTVGVEEKNHTSEIVVFPNPTSSQLNLVVNHKNSSSKFSIVDLSGKQIFSQENNTNGQAQLDISWLTSGVYFIKLFEGDELMAIKRFIKN